MRKGQQLRMSRKRLVLVCSPTMQVKWHDRDVSSPMTDNPLSIHVSGREGDLTEVMRYISTRSYLHSPISECRSPLLVPLIHKVDIIGLQVVTMFSCTNLTFRIKQEEPQWSCTVTVVSTMNVPTNHRDSRGVLWCKFYVANIYLFPCAFQ